MGLLQRMFSRSPVETQLSNEARVGEYIRRFQMAMSDRLTSNWITSPVTIDQDLLKDFVTMVVRSRDLAVNDDFVRGYLHELDKNVIGVDGIQYVPDPRFANGDRDYNAAATLSDAWEEWAQRGVCDVTGKWSFNDIERLVTKACERDGEAIVVDHPGWKGNRFGYAIQFIDCLQLDPNLSQTAPSGNEIVMGVEVDKFRRPLNYYFLKDEIQPNKSGYFNGPDHIVIPAARVHHVYHAEFAHQTRGFSQFVSAARNLKMVDGYSEAVVTAARVAAATGAVMNRKSENQGLASLTTPGSTTEQGNIKFEPGTLFDFDFDATITQIKAEQPTTTMPAAIRTWLQKFSAGIGLSYHTTAKDLSGVNYTSSRTGELSDRDKWKILHVFYARHFNNPIKDRFLKQALLKRALKQGSGSLSALRFHKYCRCDWQGRGWDWTDPSKAQKAEAAEILALRRSPLEVMRGRGDDPDKVIQDIVEYNARLQRAGLTATIEPITAKKGDDDAIDENDDA